MASNVTLNVQGMSCGHCVSSVEKSVGSIDGVKEVKVHLESGEVDVSFEEDKVSLDVIKETIDDQGYDVV